MTDGGSELIMTEEHEDDNSLLALSRWVAKIQPYMVVLAGGKGSGSPFVDFDLQDMRKRAAAKLKIQWAEFDPEAPRSRYDGKKLQKVKRIGKQILTVFPELLEESTFLLVQ